MATARAPAAADFPRNDRLSRRVQDALLRFSRSGGRKGRELHLKSEQSAYARAVVHALAGRLGLDHETVHDDVSGKSHVVVRLPPVDAPAQAGFSDLTTSKVRKRQRVLDARPALEGTKAGRTNRSRAFAHEIGALAKRATELQTVLEATPAAAPAAAPAGDGTSLEELTARALDIFDEMVSSSIFVTAHVCSMIMRLCMSSQRQGDALRIFDHCLRAPRAPAAPAAEGPGPGPGSWPELLDESCFSCAIRCNCDLGRLAAAEQLLRELGERGIRARLRSYMPLATALCAASPAAVTPSSTRVVRAFELLAELEEKGMLPATGDLLVFLQGAARAGRWADVEAVLGRFAQRFARLDEATLQGVQDALHYLAEAAARDAPRLRVFRTSVTADGTCREGGFKLRAVDISADQWAELRAAAARLFQGREQALHDFRTWLAAQPAFDVVVDAANVGYHGNNATRRAPMGHCGGDGVPKCKGDASSRKLHALLSFRQIIAMVDALRDRGGRPLVCLHVKYLKRCADMYPDQAKAFKRLEEAGLLYATPHGMNDDHYWLYAAVAGEEARRCLVVSNDEMRDHHFDMFAPSFFPRWKECHVVRYSMRNNHAMDKGIDVSLRFPPVYSTVVQTHGPTRWFFPSSESEDWLCAVEADECNGSNRVGTATAAAAPAQGEEGL